MSFQKSFNELSEKWGNFISLNNFNIEVQNRYIETKLSKKKKREWFAQELRFFFENNEYLLKEAIIKFSHIDEDNPEFFLQPKQIIKILKSKLDISNHLNQKYTLIIDKFQQVQEQEK
ncbi:MAG: hypothetical protein Q8781_02045 [Candidatus Phytoplasma stylosanthis]|uniref:hypothetical protein n=1 Tax=Candidatus Phytoplasma stylosanthis TaxID=2798314 RepID=UPI00293977D4|nr:hypothetical protein [Candidatus Phytoplasma stylosanthis]MDV3167996.1 hypothetical protein [Candidatus Phytoplasma stylosanthis]MDV3171066.1 hypothetical protein [Candidatus Phytoplasma stylosanthis]MDV3173855.1 hypothetical protein [Candidatus Phytoplasma stylosanthis]MDV3174272.1 hypothetical protein [Candidatus Phytoplasma stylosanthis]MDV3202614.1 hypothetical protein [Candidatus Phytoplasma stylosanthis]